MGIFDALRGDNRKEVAKAALKRVQLAGEKYTSFIPFLYIVSRLGEEKKITLVSDTNEQAQDDAYKMVYELNAINPESVEKYAIVYTGRVDPKQNDIRPIVFECGVSNQQKSMLFGVSFSELSDGTLKQLPGIFKVRETANCAVAKKTFASRIIHEPSGIDISDYIARIPIVITFLAMNEVGKFDGTIPKPVAEIYVRLLKSMQTKERTIGRIMSALSLHVLESGSIVDQMPPEGVSAESLRYALHVGNQILIEGVKTKQVDLDDLKVTMSKLSEYAKEVTVALGAPSIDETSNNVFSYLSKMSKDPLALSAT